MSCLYDELPVVALDFSSLLVCVGLLQVDVESSCFASTAPGLVRNLFGTESSCFANCPRLMWNLPVLRLVCVGFWMLHVVTAFASRHLMVHDEDSHLL